MSDTILIVDDEEDFRDVLGALLELNDFEVVEAKNVKEMYDALKIHDISLILLDIGFPENSGLSTLKELRPVNDIPIVLLTGQGDMNYKVVGLELGADDYITKPFHSHELVARLRNILKRTQKNDMNMKNSSTNQDVITFDGWKLNLKSYSLHNPDNAEVSITGHEYAILKTLIDASGRTLSREQLLDRVGTTARDYSPFDRSLDVMVAKVRKKLGDSAKTPKFIKTVRQAGYMFIGNIE